MIFFNSFISFRTIIVSIVTFLYPRPSPFFYSAANKNHIFYSCSVVGGPAPSGGVLAGIHSRSGDLVDILTSSGTFVFLDDLFDSECLFEFRPFRIIRIRSTYSIRQHTSSLLTGEVQYLTLVSLDIRVGDETLGRADVNISVPGKCCGEIKYTLLVSILL